MSHSADDVLQTAIERCHEVDDHLDGMKPLRWMVVVESADDDGRTVTISRSEDLAPWEALGLLRFATLQEEARTFSDEIEEDGH